ncbi:MAG: trypsin-like serine protease [Pseudomonadota bacterium]
MQRRRHLWTPISIAIALTIGACDVVQFPGASPPQERDDAHIPPPPPTTEVNPIPISDDVLDNATFDSDNDRTSGLYSDPDLAATELLAVNAAQCAPRRTETLTLAQAADAQPAAAVFAPQTVNGAPVTSAEFPGIVKMEPRRVVPEGITRGHCGATRIAENWFVTAAHCLDNPYDDIRLIATPSSLRHPMAIQIRATASICHAAYGGITGDYANDIALVGISDRDAELLSMVPVARYGATAAPLTPAAYPVARMAGWGLTGFGGNLSDALLAAELDIVAAGPAAVTVASRQNAGPCIGDSGGPLVVDEADGRPTVIGVLSVVEQNRRTGEYCEGEYLARYTNVQGYVNWIDDVVNACAASSELCTRAVTSSR